MARATRDTKLTTRAARDRLAAGKYHWRGISKGLAIGYRKTIGRKGGSWTVRLLVDDGKYLTEVLGKADDHQDANGLDVLDYFQAQEKARQLADAYAKRTAGLAAGPYTVAEAMQDYISWYEANRKALSRVVSVVNAHILPVFGKRGVAELTTREIRQWHEGLVTAPARLRTRQGEVQRAREINARRQRQATANRILTIFKAALNHAWREGRAPSDEAWRRVKPFRNVDAPRVLFLSAAEATRLINACASDFRQLVTAALLTGCRYGELTALRVNDFHPDTGTILVRESKSGKPRYIPLTDEGRQFFQRDTAGRLGSEILLLRQDGHPWGRSHQRRPIQQACEIAGIDPPISFHVLRHTYASALAMRGVPLQVIAEVLGHADTRITHRHYAHLMPSFVADTVRANLPSFGVELDNVVSLKR